MPKRIAVLGSTGSVGRQALQVADHLGLKVVGLAAGSNATLLAQQVAKYRPDWAVLASGPRFTAAAPTKLAFGADAVARYAGEHQADIVVAAISGIAGLLPTWNAVLSGTTVALANKESLVTAGKLIMEAAAKSGAHILPIDSEHSAIWQCMQGVQKHQVSRLILTASGGPFRDWPQADLQQVTVAAALAHPTWNMGNKLTVDSATLMNKGLEVMEAHWLFGVPYNQIDVVIHPESIVHSLIELKDGTMLAQLSQPDMRLPIQLAMTYPERHAAPGPRLDLTQVGQLNFSEPRRDAFPCLDLALKAGMAGQSYPIVLNAANEVAVASFLAGELGFVQIPNLISNVLTQHKAIDINDLESVLAIDKLARLQATKLLPR